MRSIQRGIATSIILVMFLLLGIAAASGYFIFYQSQHQLKFINTFEDCQNAGYPVGESYPAQCWTPDGKRFVEELSEEEKKKLIPPNQESSGTYTNSKFNFSINYPTGWLVEEDEDELYTYISPNDEAYDDLNPGKNLSINIRIFEEVEIKRTARQLAQELNPIEKTIDAKLSNIDAVIVKARKDRGPFLVGDGLFIVGQDLEIVIGSRGVKSEEDEKLINEIFSSFKFLSSNQINSFEDCQKAGYPVLKIYPGKCSTPDGRSFIQELSDEEKEGLKPPNYNK